MHIRQQFPDLLFLDALPGLNAIVFDHGYARFPRQWTRVFPVRSSNKEMEQFTEVSGLGRFRKLGTADAAKLQYDEVVPGFRKTFTHEDWCLGFKVSHQLVRDERWGLVREMGMELGLSAKETMEEELAFHFNNGFSASYPINSSGKALFSTSHPLVKAGGTQANTLSAAMDLDYVSLQLALSACRRLKRSNGQRMRVPFSNLIVHGDNEWNAAAIMESPMRHDTANNEINTLRSRDGAFSSFRNWFVWDYLTDPDSWFLTCAPEDTGLCFFWRERPYTSHDIDWESRSSRTGMWYACSHGPKNYHGVFGVQGA